MRKLFRNFTFSITAILLFTSFSLVANAGGAVDRTTSDSMESMPVLSSPKTQRALEAAFRTYYQEEIASAEETGRAVEFITPFFISACYGVGRFSFPGPVLESVAFCPELGKGDFSRMNNDGTVSVNVNSNRGTAEYLENAFDPEAAVLTGFATHVRLKITGTPVEIPLPNGTVIRFIDTSEVPNAQIWRGDGFVQEDESSPYRRMTMFLQQTPSGKIESGFELGD